MDHCIICGKEVSTLDKLDLIEAFPEIFKKAILCDWDYLSDEEKFIVSGMMHYACNLHYGYKEE